MLLKPRVYIVEAKPLEILEGVTKDIRVVIVNKGLLKTRKHLTIRLAGKTLFDKTIEINGRDYREITAGLQRNRN